MTKQKTVQISLVGPSRGAGHGDVVEADEKTASNLVAAGKARRVEDSAKKSS